MHKSRLGGLIIDCNGDELEGATEFWTRALGYAARNSNAPEDEGYVPLATAADELHIELQRVEHDSRVHLDIETDDVEAEAARLEGLGAKRIEKVKDWWIMQAPTGHRFCVVPAERADFDAEANCWE